MKNFSTAASVIGDNADFRSKMCLFYQYLSRAYYVSGIVLGILFTTWAKLHLGLNETFLEESNEFGEKEGVGRFGGKIKGDKTALSTDHPCWLFCHSFK